MQFYDLSLWTSTDLCTLCWFFENVSHKVQHLTVCLIRYAFQFLFVYTFGFAIVIEWSLISLNIPLQNSALYLLSSKEWEKTYQLHCEFVHARRFDDSRRSVEENNIEWSKLCVQWSVERLQDTGKFPASKLNRSVDRTLWNGWVLLPVLWLKITVMCSILRKAGRRMKPCDCMHASWSFAFALKVNFLNFQPFE